MIPMIQNTHTLSLSLSPQAHRLKNEASQFSQTVRMLQTAHRLLITGTPLQNK